MAGYKIPMLFCLGVIFISTVTSLNCPKPYCVDPRPCPSDRPESLRSTIVFHPGLPTCPGCWYCVATVDECPSIPCDLVNVPEGCTAESHKTELRLPDGTTCPICDAVEIVCDENNS